MLKDLVIRAERPGDYFETELMTMRSFWNKYQPGCNEHLLVRIIRGSEDHLPEISRVAEWNGRVVGAVYYTRAWIRNGETASEIAAFGPLAVEPTLEGHDIGRALMRETIRLAREAGISAIAVIGEPGYYPRFGFERCARYGITDAQGNSFDALMILPLNAREPVPAGRLIESADFEKAEDEDRLIAIEKEFPAYRKVKVQEGFMQIFGQHLGVVEAVGDGLFLVRYWETVIPAELSDDLAEIPRQGSDVQFIWNHGGTSVITRVFRNLLEN